MGHLAKEITEGKLRAPFYRMHIRPSKYSGQHQMLLEWEMEGNLVFYAAPKFHTSVELNDAYLDRKMLERSLFRKPSAIGGFTDDGPHHVSFRNGYPICICSEIKVTNEKPDDSHEKFLVELHERATHQKYGSDEFVRVAKRMAEIVSRRLGPSRLPFQAINQLQGQSPLAQIQYLSRTFFDCEALIVRPRTEVEKTVESEAEQE